MKELPQAGWHRFPLGEHDMLLLVRDLNDNGPGIPEDQREAVWKPFFKLDRSRGSQRSSGLGLSLVAAIARLHEAQLKLENRNPGTRIQIIFPT